MRRRHQISVILSALSLLAGEHLRAEPCTRCPTDATDAVFGLEATAYHVTGTNLSPIGAEGVSPSERIRIAATLFYEPGGFLFGGRGAGFSGGTLTISTLSGSFSQDVTPTGGVPLISDTTRPGYECPGSVYFLRSDLTEEFDIATHPMDIVDGNITFIARYQNGTPRLSNFGGHCPTGALSGTTFVQVHVGEGLACASPGVSLTAASFTSNTVHKFMINRSVIGICEPLMIRGNLTWSPGYFEGNVASHFSGGTLTVFTASGSFRQDVTPPGGVPVIGWFTNSGCGPPPATFDVSGFTSFIDPSTLVSDIDGDGNLTFFVQYGPTGTVGYANRDVRDVLSRTTAVQVRIAPDPWWTPFCYRLAPCGTPDVVVNGRCSDSNYFRFPATNTVSVSIDSLISVGHIHFTLNGSTRPDPGAPEYSGPFAVSNTVTVWAAAYNGDYSIEALSDPVVIEIVPVYALALGTRGGGSVSVNPPGGHYLSNTVVTLTAVTNAGWVFLGWEGASESTNVLSVTMDRGRSLQAVFGTSIIATNTGSGTVMLDPPQGPYPFGSTVRISALPNPNSFFRSWTGAGNNQVVSPLDFVVTSAMPTVRGVFGTLQDTNTFALTTLVNGNGSVTKNPQMSNYVRGTQVTLTAVTNPDAAFWVWSGDTNGSQNPLTVTMDGSKTITAHFIGGANLPPLVRIFSPTNGQIFVSPPASVTVSVTASESGTNATVVRVELYDGELLLGSKTNAPFDFTWPTPAPGEHTLRAVATDNTGLSATSEPVTNTIQALPTFSFDPTSYTVDESSNSVTVRVLKNAGTVAATVNFFTDDHTAVGGAVEVGRDFTRTSIVLSFGAGEVSQTVTIPILEDFYVEGTQDFWARLSPRDPNTVVTNDTAAISILDNDASTNSFLARGVTPIIDPATLYTLQVNLLQTNLQPVPQGQWRFTWDFNWRNSESIVRGLPAGDYEVEFKPVPGYIEPLRTIVSLTTNAQFTFFYTNTSLTQLGSLTVAIEPPFIATNSDPNLHGGWRLQGESTYRDGGTSLVLIAGSYMVQFKPVTNLWTTPPARLVSVPANRVRAITGRHYVADQSSGERPLVLDFVSQVNGGFAGGYPYVFCGQLQSDVGYGSGCAVKERVVLTAAHVVFDDVELVPVTGVNWFFQRHAGVYEPPPKAARGWCILSGYAAAKTNDPSPGISSVASKNRDVAALYFLSAAAGDALIGGFSGYLVSRAPVGEWLFNASQEMLVGYPVEGVPELNRGRMHATPIRTLTWNQESNQVFYTTEIAGYPGMSGGPLCVQVVTNNRSAFYPAAVFLGGNGRTTVRVIDGEVAELINTAEGLGDSGQNNTGPILLGVGGMADPNFEGLVSVSLLPPEVTNYGAAYRFTWNNGTRYSDWYDEQFARFKDYNATSYRVEFNRLTNPFFITPNEVSVTFDKRQPTNIFANYQAYGKVQAMAGSNAVHLLGSSGSLYRLEYTTRLPGTTSELSSVWMPLHTQRLNSSSELVTNVFPAGTTNRFLRAVLQPQP